MCIKIIIKKKINAFRSFQPKVLLKFIDKKTSKSIKKKCYRKSRLKK